MLQTMRFTSHYRLVRGWAGGWIRHDKRPATSRWFFPRKTRDVAGVWPRRARDSATGIGGALIGMLMNTCRIPARRRRQEAGDWARQANKQAIARAEGRGYARRWGNLQNAMKMNLSELVTVRWTDAGLSLLNRRWATLRRLRLRLSRSRKLPTRTAGAVFNCGR